MIQSPPPFDRQREEERLNAIFAQIDTDNEGTRNNAAAVLYHWIQKNRRINHGLTVRLLLTGTSAERTVRVIEDLERRNRQLAEENASFRKFVGEGGVRKVEQLQKASVSNGYLDEFIQAVKGMYRPHATNNIPRGASKAVAAVLGCSETTARVILRGERAVSSEEVEKIRRAPQLPLPRRIKRRKRSRGTEPKGAATFNGNIITS
ncbi:hypothetical protein [Mesorhizobium sp. M00.F.Ca.ET.217.01.1.1]|uniref:hypothetical protein n=1 Tax=Mesorhizobium sp. M00.F.Ca.ET.217.01.1.1 TaxID=2500529 RepID=UPI000FD73EB6|nr:hypothetical protein [Mesorhizobium sp. M00.F.Ca.ET.217.01.1.1]TGQ20047.1 hypothetical protein EN860_014965 [Mesorhizobium sp. M00.F.Ca.ET.217.01.1.1]TGV94500.1 hypothetical protein EN801_002395 [Mesorhizobium sp. M00.F.Ca.ET.158.01.1.1]